MPRYLKQNLKSKENCETWSILGIGLTTFTYVTQIIGFRLVNFTIDHMKHPCVAPLVTDQMLRV